MVGQQKRLSQPLRTPRAGKIAAAAVAGFLLTGVIAAIVLASTASSALRAGCIQITFPSTLGGAVTHACGARARDICASPSQNPALVIHGALREACEHARLPYGQL